MTHFTLTELQTIVTKIVPKFKIGLNNSIMRGCYIPVVNMKSFVHWELALLYLKRLQILPPGNLIIRNSQQKQMESFNDYCTTWG